MILKEVMLEWVHVATPQFKFGSETEREYAVNAVVDKEMAQKWIDDGLGKTLKPHKTLEGKFIIKLTMNEFKKDGSKMVAPRLVDKFGKSIDGLVGNGSKGSIQYRTFEWNNPKFGTGTKAILTAVMVTDLVEYGSDSIDEFDFAVSTDDVDLSDDLEF